MNDTKERKDVLQACFGQAKNTVELVEYSDDAIVSKTLLDRNAGTITLFAFDKGQGLSEHTARFDAVVQILDGTAAITIGSSNHKVDAGQIIIMPANVPHAVRALSKFKMVLTMIRQ